MPPRLQRSIAHAISAPARHLCWKIILPFVFLSVVLGLAGTYLTTRIVSGSLGERFDNQLAETARVTSDAFVRKERRQLETLRAISLTEGVAQAVANRDRAALQRFVVPIMANAGAERVDILDANGRLIFGARLTDPQNLRYDAVGDGENYASWSGVQSVFSASGSRDDKFTAVSTTQAGPYFYSSGPIATPDRLEGIVIVGAPLTSVLAQAKLEALGDVSLYDSKGGLLASTFSGEDAAQHAAPLAALLGLRDGGTPRQRVDVAEREYELLYGRLSLRGAEPVVFSVGLPSTFIASAASVTRVRMTALFVAATAVVLLIGWLIAQSITRPVLQLARTAEAVAAGDLSARSAVTSRDEIGRLARTFDMMTGHLQRQHLSTVKALTSAIDARDPYTMGHSLRVGQLSVLLGRGLRLGRLELQHLEIGGYLHDIGKIGVRDHVLLKPGILDPQEREIIETHPVIGLEIIESIELPDAVREVVGGHHERLDGTGYPYGLSAEEVTIFARIAAIADIYDALTTDRPYRPAMTIGVALEILDREAVLGRVDREVVDTMALVAKEWEARLELDAALKSHKLALVEAA